MTTTTSLADAIGRKTIAATLGVGLTAVSNAVVRGRFPSTWYVEMRRLAQEAGEQCPPELFGMKAANTSPSASHEAAE